MSIVASRLVRILSVSALALAVAGAVVPSATASGPGAVVTQVLFDNGSADVKSSIATRIAQAVASVPADTKFVQVTVMTSAPVGVDQAAPALWRERVAGVADELKSALEAKKITVAVDTTIWHQPGLKTSNPKLLRVVFFDLNW